MKILATLCCTFFSLLSAAGLSITPPDDWVQLSPDDSPSAEASWLKKSKKMFSPSLNLTTEKISVSLDEYVQEVRKIYQKNSQVRWRPLGKLETGAGTGELTELDFKTQWGAVRMLQLLLVRDNCAYIVTGAALKDEFSTYQRTFRDVFKKIQPIPETKS